MCAIFGCIGLTQDAQIQTFLGPADLIYRRGPDGINIVKFGPGAAIGHSLLSIEQVGDTRQPITGSGEELLVAFNGELYNYKNRYSNKKSEGEQLLAEIQQVGVESALSSAYGSFALVAVDKINGRLFLSVDRRGEKPLFYYLGRTLGRPWLVFSSSLSHLRDYCKTFCPEALGVNKNAIKEYLCTGLIGGGKSFFGDIKSVEPGSIVIFATDALDLPKIVKIKPLSEIQHSSLSYLDLSCSMMDEYVNNQQPKGIFLSGGLDSAVISGLLRRTTTSVNAYTLSFKGSNYDESGDAAIVANHIGMPHQVVHPKMEDLLRAYKLLPKIYEQPFGDSSALAMILLGEIACVQNRIIFTGDGGDEACWGYRRHSLNRSVKCQILFSKVLRHLMGISTSSNTLKNVACLVGSLLPESEQSSRLIKRIESLKITNIGDLYQFLVSGGGWSGFSVEQIGLLVEKNNKASAGEIFRELDLFYYLPFDVSVKIDRALMYYSIESRSMFLDDRFFALNEIFRKKESTEPKGLIKKLYLDLGLPTDLIDRKKRGFAIPIRQLMMQFSSVFEDDFAQGRDFVRRNLDLEIPRNKSLLSVNKYEAWRMCCLGRWASENI